METLDRLTYGPPTRPTLAKKWRTREEVMVAVEAGVLKAGTPPSERKINKKGTAVPGVSMSARAAKVAELEELLAGTEAEANRLRKQLTHAKEMLAREKKRGETKAAATTQGTCPAHPAISLVGEVIGPYKVLGYLCTNGTTPWWLVQCTSKQCRAQDARRGNALRECRVGKKGLPCSRCGFKGQKTSTSTPN
jgi:hypothetical protein